jgi:hypothetical protein
MPCSYCHTVGHHIRRCNSPLIDEYYNVVKSYYENMYSLNNGKSLFINFVNLNYDAITIKVMGLKYMGGILPGVFFQRNFSKSVLIEKLWEHFNGTLGYHSDILPPVPDEVPSYAQDLLSWTIDRSPDIIPPTFAEDDFIPFSPINLMQSFDAVATSKKYDINIKIEEDRLKINYEDCGICFELTTGSDMIKLNCGHKFCGQCIKGCMNVGKTSCAMCRCPMKNITVQKVEIYELVSEYCN